MAEKDIDRRIPLRIVFFEVCVTLLGNQLVGDVPRGELQRRMFHRLPGNDEFGSSVASRQFLAQSFRDVFVKIGHHGVGEFKISGLHRRQGRQSDLGSLGNRAKGLDLANRCCQLIELSKLLGNGHQLDRWATHLLAVGCACVASRRELIVEPTTGMIRRREYPRQ